MKKSLLLLLAFLGIMPMQAETVKLNGLYYSLGNTTATLVQDQSSDKSVYKQYTTVTIPDSVRYNNYTYPVKTIGTSAFEGCSELQSVTLPSTVTTINQDAFYGCRKLGSVNLEEGLTTIGQRAFYNCNLAEITIPSTVSSIGNKAFQGCPTVSVTWLPANCPIPSSTDAPFYNENNNSRVTSFTFGPNVQTVPAYICYKMSQLDTIVLPPSVKSLGQYAFCYCSNLKSINLPVTQKTLPVSFLEGCSSLESIELPATLTTISQDAFYGCSKLKKIHLHEGLTTIERRAFQNCKLDTILIPSTVTTIGVDAFQGNSTKAVTWLTKNCSIGTTDDSPFYDQYSKITSFTFGDSVQIIPNYLCYKMTQLDTVIIPPTVQTIGNYAFYYCSALKGVEIPTSVTLLARDAFAYCQAMKYFAFPQGLTTVATEVLEGCTALEEVVIPSSVTAINTDAFYNCKALRAIHNYAYTPQTINENIVYNVNKHSCILYVPIDYVDLYQSKAVWCDFDNIIGVATDLQFEDQLVNLTYLKRDNSLHHMESQHWAVPHEPRVEGFTFVGWQVQQGMLADGIVLVAVYEANDPTNAPEVFVNPANKAQKLIRHGSVYILQDDKLYTIQGQTIH